MADPHRLLQGAVDMHVHSAPDLLARRQDDLEVARAAASAGMAGVVIKSHHLATADRAALADGHVSGVRVFGGLALNAASAGGINADAVCAALAVGGKIIWMPTVSAVNHHNYMLQTGRSPHLHELSQVDSVVPVLDCHGQVPKQLDQTLEFIAEADAVLATGHLSVAESLTIIDRAHEIGVRRIVVTHPEAEMIGMDLYVQRDLAAQDVMFERCYFSVLGGLDPAKILETIYAVGVDSTILATDLGQHFNPSATDGLADYAKALTLAGLTEDDWRLMSATNPRRLLAF